MINVHLLHDHDIIIRRQLLHGHILTDLLLRDDLLVQHRRRASCELIALLLLLPLIGLDVIPLHRRHILCDHANIHIRPRPQVVEDTRLNSIRRQLDRLLPRQLLLPLRLEHRHRRQRAAAHSHVGELVCAAVGVDSEEADPGGVYASHDEVCANMALISEEMLLQHRHDGDDAGLPACGEGVKFEVGGDEGGGEFGVGGGSCSRTPYLRRDVVEFFAVLRRCVSMKGGARLYLGFDGPCQQLWALTLLSCPLLSRHRHRICNQQLLYLCLWLWEAGCLGRVKQHCDCDLRSRSRA